MSLVIDRGPGESFVIIDKNDPESFTLVTINAHRKIAIDAPAHVHILRREILHRYDVHKDILTAIERMEAARDH